MFSFFPPENLDLCNVKKYCRAGQATDNNMTHAHCMLDTKGYKHTHTHTHTQKVQYSLLSHCNNGCTNAPQCYVHAYAACLVTGQKR